MPAPLGNNYAEGNDGGAPTEYEPKYAEHAEKLCRLGATDFELADFFGVSTRTIYRWKAAHEDFCQSVKAGKELADDRVERSLYNRAVGYSFESEKIFHFQGNVTRADCVEHVPPDPGAAMNWLKNRRPDEWRDKREHELTGKGGTPLVPVLNVTIGTESEPAPEAGEGAIEPGD